MAMTQEMVELVERAKAHKMTPAERREQRISLIMGLRGSKSTLTREKVEEIIAEREGVLDTAHG